MSLLSKVKSLLGIEREQRTETVDVTIEEETAPEGEAAVEEDVALSPEEIDQLGTDTADEPETEETEQLGADTADEPEAEEAVESAASLESVKGIGPAYADRLRDAGVADVADLVAADPADLAEQTDLSETRITRWIERAEAHDS